ncbi:signal transduction histidine kinase [Novosphingobium sp. Rr 2-17]|uniref:sensor histidine kinase n=1 Tax=Novosphingobium sp. Rr 2-17 TaxID=555793 RepID=UPI000269A493|nr:PAS domain-containing protein [Novosphingobium sp. Rr 2-17]EIZ80886.1 signal transduction histidine kinase [Novosphingobium sp. Rr 2-17]
MQIFDLPTLDGDPGLKAITDFAAALCETPIALVSFVETHRQWFPARTGLDVCETSRETSFCAHAMRGHSVMVVPDATRDPRFQSNALVQGEPHIRFYAGAPLVSDDGVQVGALCVIDRAPRDDLTALQRQGLEVLAANIMAKLNLRRSYNRSTRELDEQESKFRILADTMPQMVWSTLPDGFHDYYNARWYEFTGVPSGSTDGEAWNGMFHPDDQVRAWDVWRQSLETGEPYEIEYRLRNADGEYRWTLGRALPIRDQDGAIIRWFGTCTDIHDHKMIQVQREMIAQELSHRIKNIFSVVSGLISFSTRHHPEIAEAAGDLRNRIMALGRAHDFVRPHSEASRPEKRQNSLTGMLDELLAAYSERVTIAGDDIAIDDRSATPLALLFHELATNAAKYGALSTHGGSVLISCASDGAFIRLDWQERGGPKVSEPADYGFGSKLIELSVVRQMGGVIERVWDEEGLRVSLKIPVAAMHRVSTEAKPE